MNITEKLNEVFKILKELRDYTGVNLIDNYGYRELTALELLRSEFPSIEKTIGRTGDDARALAEGYSRIEQKSNTTKSKSLGLKSFKMEFDKQSDLARREYIYKYDGFSLSVFEDYEASPIALIFIPKEQVTKIHTLFKVKQQSKIEEFDKKRLAKKNIGRDSIVVSLDEIIELVDPSTLLCWLNSKRVNSVEFIEKLKRKDIKINQKELSLVNV
jgi:hypothetical protein